MAATATSVASSNLDNEQQGPKFLYRIYLATPFQNLPPEIRLTQIAVWGSRMYDRTKIEMRFYAWMLIIIAVFDFGAWSLLFSQILTSGTPMPFLTPVSLVLGFGMAFLFFKYERQVVVYDISRGHKRLFSAFGYRSIIVVLGALLTSQPIELLLFREPIQKRIREESIRAYLAGTLGPKLAKAEAIMKNSNEGPEKQRRLRVNADIAQQLVNSAGLTKDQKRTEEKSLLEQSKTAARVTKDKRTEFEKLDKTCKIQHTECASRDKAEAVLNNAQEAEDLTVKKLDAVRRALTQDGTTLEEARKNAEAAEKLLNESYGASHKDVESDKNWADKILHTPDDKRGPITEFDDSTSAGRILPDRNYDFIQKLRILNDLKNGYPPRWPGASDQDILDTSAQFHLTDAEVERLNNSRAVQRPSQESELALYKASYRIIFGLSVIIPLMSFAFKLLMPPELANYYSVRFQEKMGNPQARSYLEQRRELESEDALLLPIDSGMQVGGVQQA